jgi:hypothetical protein
MAKRALTAPVIVWLLCILQFVAFLMFPPASFSPKSQEWWLPVLNALMALLGIMQLMVRRSVQTWPWYILCFAHGMNIISRLMMLMPRATRNVQGALRINGLYLALSVAAMLISAFYLWYLEVHEVRMTFLSKRSEPRTSS